jgi:hypothetical protein
MHRWFKGREVCELPKQFARFVVLPAIGLCSLNHGSSMKAFSQEKYYDEAIINAECYKCRCKSRRMHRILRCLSTHSLWKYSMTVVEIDLTNSATPGQETKKCIKSKIVWA